MNDELANDPTLIQEFVNEAQEGLQHLDEDLLSLERAPNAREMLDRIFRAVHTIKGTAGFLGFEQLVRVSHAAEDVLNSLRKGESIVTSATVDALLASFDRLRIMVDDIGRNAIVEYPLEELVARLRGLLPAANEAVSTAVPPESRPQLEPNAATEECGAAPGREPAGGDCAPPALVDQPPETLPAADEPAPAVPPPPEVRPEAAEPAAPLLEVRSSASAEAATAAVIQRTTNMRVEVSKLDELINLVGELVLQRNRLSELNRQHSDGRLAGSDFDDALGDAIARLSFVADQLQSASLRTRMIPIDNVFRRFPRVVRDLANQLGKEVSLEIRGQDTELDKTVVEEMADPLVHLVRNSLDHGLEMPAVREAKGKPRVGTVTLEAAQKGDHIVVTVSDDGGGIDPEKIGRKAVERGLVGADRLRTISKHDIMDFIFLPGFSTAEKVNNLSGRGVGLDVVRTNLKKLNGSVTVESHLGLGTVFTLQLPLTLAVIPVLLVRIGLETYALPLRSVVETVHVRRRDVHDMDGTEILHVGERILPFCRLERLFGLPGKESDLMRVVILGIGEQRMALAVDQFLGQEQTVIKSLGSCLRHVPGIAGATISGDGHVRLIVDPAGLLSLVQRGQVGRFEVAV
jgi:two-component system chemotaxis sensor kinase CheA